MINELIKSMMLIIMAEMGDKTQILAMAFATKYRVKKVMLGIFIGALLNHGIAVLLGSCASNFIPLGTIQIVAGALFIGFAVWTLRAKDDDEEEHSNEKYGPVITVAAAFFIGELGDKTQLAAITLASDASFPAFVLMGTVSGMVITGGLGIIVGRRLGKNVPELAIKVISAAIFMAFGLSKLYRAMPVKYMTVQNEIVFVGVLAAVLLWAVKPILDMKRSGRTSLFRKKSQEIYNYYKNMNERIEDICLGEGICGKCEGTSCIIGYIKLLLKGMEQDGKAEFEEDLEKFKDSIEKDFDRVQIEESLKITNEFLRNRSQIKELSKADIEYISRIKKILERLLK